MVSNSKLDNASRIDARVVEHLNNLAQDLSELGLELFMFGSVAQTYPLARKGADLDLGIRAKAAMQLETRLERMRYAKSAIEQLPTIRPVDLVDFDTIGVDFKELALQHRLDFPLAYNGSNDVKRTWGF